MNLALTVLNITAPVFILAAVGFTWVKLGFEYRVEFVTRLAMTLAVPCLVFTALINTELAPSALSSVTLAALAAYGIVTIVGWLAVSFAGLDRRTYLAPMIFGNTGNLGLPLALFAFGPEGLSLAVVVFAVTAVWSFTLGVWLVSAESSLKAIFREPLVGATILGALFLWQGWSIPEPLFNALDLIGQMAIPMMLITLGVAVARLRPTKLPRAVVLSIVKVIACAGLTYGVALALGLSDMASAVLILQMSTPVAVTSYLLAEKYGADSASVAGLVVVSTLLSVAYLPILLAVLL